MYATFKYNFQDLHLEHYNCFVHARFVFCIDLHHKFIEIGLVCLFRKYLFLVSLVSSQLATFVVLQIWCNLLLALMGSWLQRDQDHVIVFDWPLPEAIIFLPNTSFILYGSRVTAVLLVGRSTCFL